MMNSYIHTPPQPSYSIPIRAKRRLQRERKVSKAQKVLRSLFGEDKVQQAPLWADNLQKCSCHMCMNPRRNSMLKGRERLTLAEQKSLDDFQNSKFKR